MRIGFLTSSSIFSQLRHDRLIRALQHVNLQAEWYNPFGDYDFVVVESGAIPKMDSLFHRNKGAKLILHVTETPCLIDPTPHFEAMVVKEGGLLGAQNLKNPKSTEIKQFIIRDGVDYNPEFKTRSRSPIRKLVWFGAAEDAQTLLEIQPFLKNMAKRGASLTVLMDKKPAITPPAPESIITEIKPFDDYVVDYDMAVLPCGNPWAVKTAWLQNVPTLYVDSDDLYTSVPGAWNAPERDLWRGIIKPSEWLDFFDLHEQSPDLYQRFRLDARRWVIDTSLVHHECSNWIKVFESCAERQIEKLL